MHNAVNANVNFVQTMPGLLDNGGTPRCPADGICPFEIKTDVSSTPVTEVSETYRLSYVDCCGSRARDELEIDDSSGIVLAVW